MVLNNKLIDLEKESGVNVALLMTVAIGIASEGGEFSEIVKLCIFQGNPMDDETVFIANENLVTLCGIGLIVVRLGLIPTK